VTGECPRTCASSENRCRCKREGEVILMKYQEYIFIFLKQCCERIILHGLLMFAGCLQGF